ncbi:pilus assembly protein PilM [Candidatus Saganbacteria bacterium]|uniref:Pilus assembly protein PilM n=1 Tax=Candidatus Saganbacteria bacterium TaxID=2575572 RepID=A0A9D6UKF4_UNCSA|nr:pilus assembly protein PilM [Candidatus Saganbacteria bacterium]
MPTSRILGVDLMVTSVKVAEVEKSEKGFTLKNWGMTEVPYQLVDKHPQLEDAKADALRKLVQTNKIRTREAVVVEGDAFVRLFTMSDLPRAEAAEAIRWKFAEEIPFPIEEAFLDFYPIFHSETFTEKADYVAACINRKLYLENRYILNKAGLKLAGITVLPDVLRELFSEEIVKGDEKIVSIIYMGRYTTNLSIFRRGNFEFGRELNFGGESLTLAMSGILVSPTGKIEVTPEEAERIKLEYGVPVDLETFPKLADIPLTQLQAMARPVLEKIQNEIARTFEYYKGQTGEASVDKIILTGGGSQTKHLKEFLSDGLGIPVLTPEPIPQFNPRLAGALGVAILGTRKINLLPEDMKHPWKVLAQKFSKPVFLAPALLGLLVLIYLLVWLQAFSLQNELNNISRKMEDYRPRMMQLETFEKASKEEEKKRLNQKSNEEKKGRTPKILEEISRVIPDSVQINTMNFAQGNLRLAGTAYRKGEAAESILARFVLKLSTSPLFENVQMVQASKNSGYTTEAFDFEIMAKIKENL